MFFMFIFVGGYFFFLMVLYEILLGERFYCEYKNMVQILRVMKMEVKRLNFQVNKE